MNGLARPDRTLVDFTSHGTRCQGWFYRPNVAGPAPCIVLAHGLGGTVETGLSPYARRFAEAGYAVFAFDYRGFGRSHGAPRQVVSTRMQLEDWQAAIDTVRELAGVDPERIALWGSSFSGGHVVVAAIRDGRVKAISAQCPMMDGIASSLAVLRYAGLFYALRLLAHAARDLVAALLGSTHLIPLTAAPGQIAAMSSADADAGLSAIRPPDFVNAISARIALTLAAYRPGRSAGAVPCPVLIQVCEHDSVAPARAAEAAARRAGPRATLMHYPCGHFDLYVGDAFERSVQDQLCFFERHLRAA